MAESRVLERRSILKGRVLDIGVERVELPGGHTTDLEILRHPGAAAILAVTDSNEIVLIRQYRHAAGEYLWEVPAGTRDGEEPPLDCARRELSEETGFTAEEWTDLGEMLPAPGYACERIHLYLARGLGRAQQKLDEDEVIAEVRPVPVAEALRWVADGTVIDAKTAVALCRAQLRGLLS
ncbi:MAG: NUDIX hydrolase [Candidatus Binatia bacterium]|nr:NUDIX hydrolase [Candidatus Binatia bacterium]